MSPEAGVLLASVLPGSPAARAGLQAGDRILTVDRQPVEDALDLAYAVAEDVFTLSVQRGRKRFTRHLERQPGEPWGGMAEPPALKRCGNRCVFCFVDQMPEGLRPSLYIKDEDYRHSFLFGNYVTLTNLKSRDLERIKQLHLSPLYISVHATDPQIRLRLLGRKQAPPILPILQDLVSAGIQLHTQAVICPGWNDGAVLKRTVGDLAGLYPGVASIALVPVGLSAHRQNLATLRSANRREARAVLDQVSRWQKQFLRQHGTRLVFATDEWYVRAGRAMPRDAAYEDYPQIENGVGIARQFLEETRQALTRLPRGVSPRRILIPNGKLSAGLVRRALKPLKKVKGLDFKVIAVPNRLFGPQVTVTGLLSGQDILAALLPEARHADQVILPPEPLRHEKGIFLDDMRVRDLGRKLGLRVHVAANPKQLVRKMLA
jgi:putative radical SAM enzyme (TIGR03279 family)